MLDHMQIIFWSITYLLIVGYGIKYRHERSLMMPLFCGSLNIAWELNAIISSKGFYGHFLWLSLDIIIFVINLFIIERRINRALYGAMTLALFISLWFVFSIPNGMLVSVFLIDLIMAIEYVLTVKRISVRGKIPIATFRLLGDFFAWLCYWEYSLFVAIVGAIVMLLNLFYLCYCLEESNRIKDLKRKK